MNAEQELYPQEALADEEPRYLRRQKPLAIRRRKFGQRSWPAYRRWMLVGAGLLAGGFMAYQSFRFLLFSPRVQLASFDQIEITGNRYVSSATIADKFTPDLGKSIIRVPLNARRAALETLPWVGQASVERALPNRIRVELTERIPVAFLRTGDELDLVDAGGIILDRPVEADFHFPVITGLDDSMAVSDRAARMQLFVEFLKEIDLARAGASDQVSDVDLSDAQDVRASIAGLPGLEREHPVAVHFGDSDFVNKYRLLVDNIGPWRASAGRVESVDLRFSRQAVVNPESDAVARAMPPALAQTGKR
jgi:cell division protein FtsQ